MPPCPSTPPRLCSFIPLPSPPRRPAAGRAPPPGPPPRTPLARPHTPAGSGANPTRPSPHPGRVGGALLGCGARRVGFVARPTVEPDLGDRRVPAARQADVRLQGGD